MAYTPGIEKYLSLQQAGQQAGTEANKWMDSLLGESTLDESTVPNPPPQKEWPEGFYPKWDSQYMEWHYVYDPDRSAVVSGMTEEELRYLELSEEKARRDYEQTLWERQQSEATGAPGDMSEWQRAQMELAQQQLAAEQGWKQQEYGLEQQQYASQLAAQPKSWLEYAAYTGQPPVVQPWMLPLMPQEYAGLEGLRAGQPVPGWPEQFTGSNAPYGGQPYGGQGTQPSTPTDQYAGTTGAGVTGGSQTPTGYGTSIPTSRFSAYGTPAQGLVSGNLGTLGNYVEQGMSPYDAALQAYKDAVASGQDPELAEYATSDALRLYWEQTGTKPTVSGLAGLQISSLGARPETFERYGEAISNVESGDPLLRDISSREKMQLVTQMINQGMDRTLAERQVFGGSPAFSKYTPIGSLADTSTPEVSRWLGAATTGESQTASYPEPSKPLPTPTKPTTPIGDRKPREKVELAPKPFEPKKTLAYIPGRSWHDVDPQGIGPEVKESGWLDRLKQLYTESGRDITQTKGAQYDPSGPQLDTRQTVRGTQPSTRYGGTTPTGAQTPQWVSGSQAPQSSQYPLGGMPEMVRPSRQYQARMGPTALQQYYAYNQARTGTTPEELQWRLQNTAPPGGGYPGLTWMR